jgi:heptosyltransferase-2
MKILIIQQKRIGDVLTSTILCNNLKKKYPDAIIDYMCYSHCIDVLIGNPNINEIIVLEQEVRKSYRKLFKFFLRIRKRKYNVIIDAYSKLETNLITLFSGAETKISYHKSYSFFFYNHNMMRIKNGTKSDLGLAIDNRLMLLEPLITEPLTNYKPRLFLTPEESKESKEILKNANINTATKPLVMFSILGSEWYKSYPFKKMAELIDHTVAQTNGDILFNYIPSQIEDATKIYDFCTDKTKANIHFNIYGKSLRQFLGLLSNCNMLIGNEGGTVNMAKALNVPTFSLFSPSVDKETWQIFEDNKNISIHLKDIKPEIYEQHDGLYIKKHTFKFFDEYPIELIKDKLDDFFNSVLEK